MWYRRISWSVVALGLLAAYPVGNASAEDKPPEPGPRVQNPEFRQRMLDEFDKDGNGQLDETERQAMREKMQERRAQMRERFGRGGPDGPPPPPRGDQPGGPDGRDGHRGPGGPGPLEGLFSWFDSNHDDQLSREEFHDLAMFVHQRHRPGPPPGGPDGPGFDRRGPDGPPPPPPGEGFGRGGPRGRWWGEGRGGRGPGDGPPHVDGTDSKPQPADSPAPPSEKDTEDASS
jgi:hypothetical protein